MLALLFQTCSWAKAFVCRICKLTVTCAVQAGSDSLLTSFAFVKLAASRFNGFEQLQGHKGVLFGLGVDGNTEMILTEH